MTLGLALGGGGLRGAAHIGVLQVLLSHRIAPQMLAGTSAGSIVAALYASGISPQQMADLFSNDDAKIVKHVEQYGKQLNTKKWHSMITGFPMGLIRGNTLEFVLKKLLRNKTFDELDIATFITATDLYNGQLVIFGPKSHSNRLFGENSVYVTGARVHEAVRASISIPGIFVPKIIGKRALVDGGLVDNVPADLVRNAGATKVMAVDLGFAVIEKEPFTNVLQVLLQTADIMGNKISRLILENYADLVLQPKTGATSLWDFKRLGELVEAGAAETTRMMSHIKTLVDG